MNYANLFAHLQKKVYLCTQIAKNVSMHIVILGTAWPYRGGLATFNERLARQFIQEGHTVDIVTFTLQYPDFLFPGKTQYSDAPEPTDLHIQRAMNSISPFSWIKTGRMIRKMNADVLVIKFWTPLMAPCLGTIARIARKKGMQVVSILDNVIPHEPKPWDNILIRYFVRSVDRFIAMSDSVLQDCKRFDSRKPKTLTPHPLYDNFGVPVSRKEAQEILHLDPQYTYLLFFGFIRDYKGLDLLLKAFAQVKSAPDTGKLKLLIAGEFYNNAEQYYRLEKELGLEGEIIWRTDFIPDDQVRFYFSAADLIVQPYKSATQSGVTQIAYHFEKPMLVTRVGGLAEIVPDGEVGYVCEVDSASVAAAINDFIAMSGEERTAKFSANIQAEKAKYAWSGMTKAILQQN